jgi:sulfur-oxidizing protein SoxZ
MATSHPIRLSLIGPVRAGQEVEVRLLIGHPMDSGYRTDDAGQRIARNIIESVRVQLDGQMLLDAEVSIGVSANPYFSFPLLVPARGGTLLVEWVDDHVERGQLQKLLLLE